MTFWAVFAIGLALVAANVGAVIWLARTSRAPVDDDSARFVRRSSYDADRADYERRLTAVEADVETKFRQLSGMISRSRRGARLEEQTALAEQAAEALQSHRKASQTDDSAAGLSVVGSRRLVRRNHA